jgi:hypothetical protein
MQIYQIYNLLINSDIDMPFIKKADYQSEKQDLYDISVELSTQGLEDFCEIVHMRRRFGGYLRSYGVGDGTLLCVDSHVKIYVDEKGASIVIDADEKNLELALAYTISLGLSLCMLYLGLITLHAASVDIEGKRIGIMAKSGTGKSSLLWNLLKQGALFVTDDVLPIHVTPKSTLAVPSVSLHSKLWDDQIRQLGIERERCHSIITGGDKFWVKIDPEQRALESRPLDALFVLEPQNPDLRTESPDQLVIRQQNENVGRSLLLEHTHGLWAMPMEPLRKLIPNYIRLAQRVPIYTLSYVRSHRLLPVIVDLIQQTIVGLPSTA